MGIFLFVVVAAVPAALKPFLEREKDMVEH